MKKYYIKKIFGVIILGIGLFSLFVQYEEYIRHREIQIFAKEQVQYAPAPVQVGSQQQEVERQRDLLQTKADLQREHEEMARDWAQKQRDLQLELEQKQKEWQQQQQEIQREYKQKMKEMQQERDQQLRDWEQKQQDLMQEDSSN